MRANTRITKQHLHDVLIQSMNSVIAILEPYVRSGRIPKQPITEAHHRSEGGYLYQHYHRRDYTGLATRHSLEWMNLPVIKKSIQELINDKDVQQDFNVVGFGNLHDYVTNQILCQFIYRVLRLTRRWPPARPIIETSFLDLEDYLLNNTIYCEATVPLQNFECAIRRLNLEQGLEIRELSESDKEKIVTRAITGSLENEMEALRHRFAVIIEMSWAKGSTPTIDHRPKLNKLLTALRLFKTGEIGANVVYRREPKWQPGHIVGGAGRDIYSVPVTGPIYQLNPQEATDFLHFWKWIYQMPFDGNTEVAIRWFNHGYEDWIPEDKIISFMTAFESLFLRDHEPKGKSLVNRIPKLLTNSVNRGQMEKDVKAMWDFRSDVVHARPYQANQAPRIADMCERYLRESIKRYVELERNLRSNSQADVIKWLQSTSLDINIQNQFFHWKAI
jgi:hypothetical protein